MRIIDAHNHPDWHGHDLDRFLANMDRHGIEKTWLLNWECPKHESASVYDWCTPGQVLGGISGPVPFARCVNYKERAPDRFILGYAPDPRLPDACDRLRAAHEIYGARVCGELKVRMTYDNPDALRVFRLAGKLKMPVVFHLQYDFQRTVEQPWNEWFGGTIDAVERALAACPDTIFLGHAPGFWIHISDDDQYTRTNYPEPGSPVVRDGRVTQLLRRYPNLYCDISAGSGRNALARDPAHAVDFLNEFQDRVLFARDYFDNGHREFLDGLGLSKPVLKKIYAENAERLVPDFPAV